MELDWYFSNHWLMSAFMEMSVATHPASCVPLVSETMYPDSEDYYIQASESVVGVSAVTSPSFSIETPVLTISVSDSVFFGG